MDIYKLSSTDLQPVEIVENLSSIHWVDKFNESGEFTLESPDIDNLMRKLPPGTYLGNNLDDSMMYVETHSVRTDDQGVSKLTIKGGGGTSFLKHRYLVEKNYAGIDDCEYEVKNITPWDLMLFLLNNANDMSFLPNEAYTLGFPYRYYTVNSSTEAYKGKPITRYEINRESCYAAMADVASSYGLGFRLARPTNPAWSGPVLDIRPGRILTNQDNPMFSAHRGDFRSEAYEHDIKDTAHVVGCFVKSYAAHRSMYGTTYFGDYVHRARLIDLPNSEPRASVTRSAQKATEGIANVFQSFGEASQTVGETVLNLFFGDFSVIANAISDLFGAIYKLEILKYQEEVVASKAELYAQMSINSKKYSFEVSPSASAKYKTDYRLGDIVTLQPSFGDMVDMRVNAYVRSEDESGYREYPEFIEYNPIENKLEYIDNI